MKRRIVTLLILVGLAVASCTTEKQNVITGKVEGLQVGDKIILLVEDLEGAGWIPTDSTIVEREGEFTITTNVTGNYIQLQCKNNYSGHIFLEDYANLNVTGSVDNWYYAKVTGGIYDHPDLQEIMRIVDSGKVIQQEALAFLDEGRATNDTGKLNKGRKLINESNDIIGSSRKLENGFIAKHPDLAYSAGMLRYKDNEMENFEEYENTFNALSPKVQSSSAGLSVKQYINNTKASSVGAKAPDFTLTALDGQAVTLSAFRGQYVLLDFWGSWCSPCRQSSPKLVKLYGELKDKNIDIEFIGVACNEESDENWKKAVEDDSLTWVHVSDAHSPQGKSVQKSYAIDGVPTCILVSPEGEILYKEHPYRIIPEMEKLFGMVE